jgi:hypothetical protein
MNSNEKTIIANGVGIYLSICYLCFVKIDWKYISYVISSRPVLPLKGLLSYTTISFDSTPSNQTHGNRNVVK